MFRLLVRAIMDSALLILFYSKAKISQDKTL